MQIFTSISSPKAYYKFLILIVSIIVDTGSSWRSAKPADAPKDDWKRNDSDDTRYRSRREMPPKENEDNR